MSLKTLVRAVLPPRVLEPVSAWRRRLDGEVEQRLPIGLRVPFRYWYHRVTGRLDQELPLALRLLRPGSLAIDVGANVGLYAYALAARAGAVEAFEPLPACADCMRAFAGARHPIVHVHQVALGDAAGELEMYIPLLHGRAATESASFTRAAGPSTTLRVPVRTLDGYDFRGVSLIKIDVEGHEAAVLRGSRETIARERPALIVEIEQRHHAEPMTQVFDLLCDMGYRGGFLDPRGAAQPLAAFSYDRHQAPYLHDPNDPCYVNNFVFLPADDPRRRALGL